MMKSSFASVARYSRSEVVVISIHREKTLKNSTMTTAWRSYLNRSLEALRSNSQQGALRSLHQRLYRACTRPLVMLTPTWVARSSSRLSRKSSWRGPSPPLASLSGRLATICAGVRRGPWYVLFLSSSRVHQLTLLNVQAASRLWRSTWDRRGRGGSTDG